MLNHEVIGPNSDNRFLVVYPTPGCKHIMTIACDCRTSEQAINEADRLNIEQVLREYELQNELKY